MIPRRSLSVKRKMQEMFSASRKTLLNYPSVTHFLPKEFSLYSHYTGTSNTLFRFVCRFYIVEMDRSCSCFVPTQPNPTQPH